MASYYLLQDLTFSLSLRVLGLGSLPICKQHLALRLHFQGFFSQGVTLPPPCFPLSTDFCVILLGERPKYPSCLPRAAVFPCRVRDPHLAICWGNAGGKAPVNLRGAQADGGAQLPCHCGQIVPLNLLCLPSSKEITEEAPGKPLWNKNSPGRTSSSLQGLP